MRVNWLWGCGSLVFCNNLSRRESRARSTGPGHYVLLVLSSRLTHTTGRPAVGSGFFSSLRDS